MPLYYNNILETIGNTPMVKLNKTVADVPALVLGKIETFNPGHSIKDRMALKMLEDAEKDGRIQPGGTIIECTSGNTGMGLAIAAAVKGYKCIFTTSDKQSKEKLDLLRAFGSEVVVCPTNVEPDDPRSYYSVAEKLSKEIPNSCWFNQYDNLSNTKAHYESTGPEIWKQTEGRITHLIVGVGTGGTVSGTARYLKEQNPDIQVWGIDTYGSVFKKYHETGIFDTKEIYPYITEGIGEDILPKNVDFSLIDHFEKVTDKDGALAARRLAREEGILLGYSAGSALAGLLQLKERLTNKDVVVIIFHDHGSRYVGKIFNDDWMRDRGFLDTEMKVKHLIEKKVYTEIKSVPPETPVREVLQTMKDGDFSQLPIIENGKITGSISQNQVLEYILFNPLSNADKPVTAIAGKPFPEVSPDLPLKEIYQYMDKNITAVTVVDHMGRIHIITQYDILQFI
ncbi:MAG TPA: pyridoxal-phosphate dependent enzyme [Saprospiraceae bacterium]|nr:pyridoxal-phosphate dependent enzyme [Saprospiraceae bacterium]